MGGTGTESMCQCAGGTGVEVIEETPKNIPN